jgi:hypothetical protein
MMVLAAEIEANPSQPRLLVTENGGYKHDAASQVAHNVSQAHTSISFNIG